MYRVRRRTRPRVEVTVPAAVRVSRWLTGVVTAAAAATGGLVGCDGPPPTDGVRITLTFYDDTGFPPMRSHDEGDAAAVPEAWVIAEAVAAGEGLSDRRDDSWIGRSVYTLADDELAALGGERAEMVDGQVTFRVPEGRYVVCMSTGGMSGCHLAEMPAHGSLEASWGEGGFGISP